MQHNQGSRTANATTTAFNPFAQALAERRSSNNQPGQFDSFPDSVTQALAGMPTNPDWSLQNKNNGSSTDPFQPERQAREAERRRRRLQRIQDLKAEEEKFTIYQATDKKNKAEIEKIRDDLKDLSREVTSFNKEISVALNQNVGDVGSGVYHRSFFDHLRRVITLLKQSVRSAKTWFAYQNSKVRKKGPTLGLIKSKKANTSTVNNWQHHEQSTARSVG